MVGKNGIFIIYEEVEAGVGEESGMEEDGDEDAELDVEIGGRGGSRENAEADGFHVGYFRESSFFKRGKMVAEVVPKGSLDIGLCAKKRKVRGHKANSGGKSWR